MPAHQVVVIGGGLAGLATALAAHENRRSVVLVEKAPLLGGAAAYSGGQVWVTGNRLQKPEGIDDSISRGCDYILAMNDESPEYGDLLDRRALETWLHNAPRAACYFESLGAVTWEIISNYPDYYLDLEGAAPAGRYLTARFDSRRLGEWRERLRVSPHFPVGITYRELFESGMRASALDADDRSNSQDADGPSVPDIYTFGPGVVAGFLAAVVERGIDVRVGCAASELILRDGRVVGARVEYDTGASQELFGDVVLATSAFDWSGTMVDEFIGLPREHFGSVAPRSLTGDGIALARQAGAAIRHFPPARIPLVLGYQTDREPGFTTCREHQLPHTFLVDSSGRRFADDGLYWEVTKAVLATDSPHRPFWMIWDETHRQKYGLGATEPGGKYPQELVVSAPTLEGLGGKLGIDGTQLAATAERFNYFAALGHDPDFGRGANETAKRFAGDPSHHPNPAIGPVDKPPFYATRLRLLATGIGLTGVMVDEYGRALDEASQVVDGLFAVGAAAAFTSSGVAYNSGFSLSRAITFGLLVGESAQAL